MRKKSLTNEQRLSRLLKSLKQSHPLYSALLRERVVHIMDLTLQSIEQEPDKWNNAFVHPNVYRELANIVREEIGFDEP